VLSAARTMPAVLVAGVIFGAAQGLLYPTMNALVADWSTARNIGRTQSLFSGSYSLGIASCSFFFGTIAERHGFAVMFLVAFAVTLVGLGTFLAGPRDLPSAIGVELSGGEELVDVNAQHGKLE
jgi:MFS family permease